MPKQGDFDFDVVRLPYEKTILEPHFHKDHKIVSVCWNGRKVTEVKVTGTTEVKCNGVSTPIQDLTNDILKDIGSHLESGNQWSRRWKWKGKRLDHLHTDIHTSRKITALLRNGDFIQDMPNTFCEDEAQHEAQTDTWTTMPAFALCIAVTTLALADPDSSGDETKERFFIAHALNLLLAEELIEGLIPPEDVVVFKTVFDEYCQALEKDQS